MDEENMGEEALEIENLEDEYEVVFCPFCPAIAMNMNVPWEKPGCKHLRFIYSLGEGFSFSVPELAEIADKVEDGNSETITTCNNSDVWDTLKVDLAGTDRREKWENWEDVDTVEKSKFWDVLKTDLGPGGTILEDPNGIANGLGAFTYYLGFRRQTE